MKILVLPSWYNNDSNPLGGLFFKEQTQALLPHGIAAAILYVDFRRRAHFYKKHWKSLFFYKSKAHEGGIPTYRINGINLLASYEWNRKLWCRLSLKLFEYYRRENGLPNLIHAHSYFAGYVASLLKEKYNIPYLLTEHTSSLVSGDIIPWHCSYIEKAYQNANILAAVGPILKNSMQQYTQNNIIVTPNFIDTHFFKPTPKTSNNSKKIFTVGHLIPRKNFQLLINAFAQSKLHQKGWTLAIGGGGMLQTALQNQIENLELTNSIQLLGQLDREAVKKHLNQATIFAMSSQAETFGVVAIEAMAMGVPVIATECGGPEAFISPATGLVCANKEEALRDALLQMADEINNYDANSIRSYAVDHFSNEVVTKQLIAQYQSLKM